MPGESQHFKISAEYLAIFIMHIHMQND